ncbi:MAG: class I SAM-dependent methyltransferase [Candidatus Omnitrophota bacterium]
MSNIFDKYYKKYDAWYDKNRFAYLSEVEAMRKNLPKTGKGLEIGVGTGRFAASLGIKYGIDPAKNMLKIASKRGVDVQPGSGEKLPFNNGSFDYVALIITLSFVKDPEKVLKEANRVLRKTGKIIAGIIDKNSFLGRYYKKKKGPFYKNANLLKVEEVKDLLTKAGFVRISCNQTIFRLPGEMKSVHKTSKGFGRGGFVVVSAIKKR